MELELNLKFRRFGQTNPNTDERNKQIEIQESQNINQDPQTNPVSHTQNSSLIPIKAQSTKMASFASLKMAASKLKKIKISPYIKYEKKSLGFLNRDSLIRGLLIQTALSKDYDDPDSIQPYNQTLDIIDQVFSAIYTMEAIIKIFAFGFIVHQKSYMRDPWNIFDLAVVIISWISILPNIPNLKSLRTLRVMRPLRSIKAVPSMRRLVNSLLLSLPQLVNIVFFFLFMSMIFGILGIQAFQGNQYQLCRLTQFPLANNTWPTDPNQYRACGGAYQCLEGTYCGALQDYGIPVSQDDLINNPQVLYNIVNFDNIFKSLLSVFMTINLAGWSSQLYLQIDCSGYFAVAFYVFLVIAGAFFSLNVFLAVIMNVFSDIDLRMKTLQIQKKKQEKIMNGLVGGLFSQLGNKPTGQQVQKKYELKDKKKPTVGSMFMKIQHENKKGGISSIQEKLSILQPRRQSTLKGINQENLAPQQNSETHQYLYKLRKYLYDVCQSKVFSVIITMVIIGNTVSLALDKYPPDPTQQKVLDVMNIIFFAIFALEMIVKLIGMGIKGYLKDRFNIFDGIIIILSIADITLQYALGSDNQGSKVSGGGAISAFRVLRLFRILKLVKQWSKLQHLLKAILHSLKDIQNFSILLFLFMFIYVLIALEFYANQIKFDENYSIDLVNGSSPRLNCDSFFNTFIFVFYLLHNWDSSMLDFVRIKGNLSILYFISFVIFGQLILLNLFLAILLKNFDESEVVEKVSDNLIKEKLSKQQKMNQKILNIKNWVLSKKCWKKKGSVYSVDSTPRINESSNQILEKDATNYQDLSPDVGQPRQDQNVQTKGEINQTQDKSFDALAPADEDTNRVKQQNKLKKFTLLLNDNASNDQQDPSVQSKNLFQFDQKKQGKKSIHNIISAKTKENEQQSNSKIRGNSLYFFGEKNKFRLFVAEIVKHKYFDHVVLCIILIQSVFLVIDDPLSDPKGVLNSILGITDIVFTSIFSLEIFFKIICDGLILNGKDSFLRNGWNNLDFVIVTLSIYSTVQQSSSLKSIKSVRLLRILRPLRIIARNQGLRLAVSALINAIPFIFNVVAISLLCYLIFGVVAVNYLKGSFFYCYSDNSFTDLLQNNMDQLVQDKFDCLNYGGIWINRVRNFDNIFDAILVLFQIASTTDEWQLAMFYSIDSVAIDFNPVTNNRQYWIIYFVVFLIIGNTFFINLFVGVMISTFNREKDLLGKNFLLTPYQRMWVEQKVVSFNVKPKVIVKQNHQKLRIMLQKFVNSKIFEGFIMGCIIVNTIVLMITWYNQPVIVGQITDALNYGFAIIFTIEAVLKLAAFGFKDYFAQAWNQFDFTIVVLTILSTIITLSSSANLGAATTFLRAFKITRILRLIRKAKSLMIIFETFTITIPALANVGCLLFLFVYIYAILGMQLFAEVKLQDILNEQANFQTFGMALLTLIRCSTGEDWNALMDDAGRKVSPIFQCVSGEFDYDIYMANGYQTYSCGHQGAYAFFNTFMIVVSLIFLNLFIAIIIEGFDNIKEKSKVLFKEEDIESFRDAWAHFDPQVRTTLLMSIQGIGLIEVHQLHELLFKLGTPLGWDQSYKGNKHKIFIISVGNVEKQDDFLEDLSIRTYTNFKHYLFWDVLSGLIKLAMIKKQIDPKNKQEGKGFFSKDEVQVTEEAHDETEEQKMERIVLLRLELEFEHFDQSKNEAKIVKETKEQESKVKSKHNNPDQEFSSAHFKAGRKIYQLMKTVQERRFKKMQLRKKVQIKASGWSIEQPNQNELKESIVKQKTNSQALPTAQTLQNDKSFSLENQLVIKEEDSEAEIQDSFDREDWNIVSNQRKSLMNASKVNEKVKEPEQEISLRSSVSRKSLLRKL